MRFRAVYKMILTGLLSIGLVGGLFYLSPNIAYANLLSNEGFETDDGGGDPTVWAEWTDANGQRETDTYRSGSASYRAWTTGSADTGNGIYQSFSASVGQVYVASVYIQSKSGDPLAGGAEAFIKLEFKNSGGTTINFYESNHLSSSNSGWERHTVVGTAPLGTATVQMNCVVWTAVGGASGAAYFDDADLHQVTTSVLYTSSNVMINEGFETGDGQATERARGWRYWEDGTGVATLSSSTYRNGSKAAQLTVGTSASNATFYYKNFSLEGGQIVDISVYVKSGTVLSANTNAYCSIEWYKRDDSTKNYNTGTYIKTSTKKTGTFDWTELTLKDQAPAITSTPANNTRYGRVVLIIMNDASGSFGGSCFFDDLTVKVGPGGNRQKTVANTPNVCGSSGWKLAFNDAWGGGFISEYYDYQILSTGATNSKHDMISSWTDMHALFDIQYQYGGEYVAPSKNKTGRMTVVEQSPTRTVIQSYAIAVEVEDQTKAESGNSDAWTITYNIYPDGRIFITDKVEMGSEGNTPVDGPDFALSEKYYTNAESGSYNITDDTNVYGALTPTTTIDHHASIIPYNKTHDDWDTTAYMTASYRGATVGDTIHEQLECNPTKFTSASGTHIHCWVMDIGTATQTAGTLSSLASDYRTHTSGSDLTFDTGSLVTGLNTDGNSDGYDEGAGCWNVLVSSNNLEFTLNAATQTVTRYKPAFFITGYTDTQLPGNVKVDAVAKEQGTNYNISFVPFSKVYKRYASAQPFSTIYARSFDDVGSTTNYDYVTDSDQTNYAYADITGSQASLLDVKGFHDLGSIRDIASATAYVVYKTVGTPPASKPDYYKFDAALDGSTFDVSIVNSNTAAASDTTGSASLGTVTDAQIFKTPQVRMSTVGNGGPDGTAWDIYWKLAYIGGTYNADEITDAAADFNTSTTIFNSANDYLYVGSLYKYAGILVDIATGATSSITPTWEYYNGSAWTTLTVTDNTSGFTKDGMVTFTAPGDWATYNKTGNAGAGSDIGGNLHDESLYYVRIKRTAGSSASIRGLATNNLIFQYMSDVTTDAHFSLVGATMVDLVDFYAIGYFGKVKLFWKTESELNNIGFNILRSEDGKNYVKVNKEIIPGLGTNIIGKEYLYEDIDVVNGKTYYYLLEDVEGSGKTTTHGPVAAHPGLDFDSDGMTDDWEYYYGLPATVYDANVDSDDDGLTNLEEFLAGTNPLVIDSENLTLSQNSGVTVIESAGLKTVLELNTSTFKVADRNVDGVIYQIVTLPEYTHGQTTDVGKPQIPTKGVLFGTLSKKPVTINVLESEKETLAGYNLYPVPKAVMVQDPNDPDIKRLTYEFYKDTNAYTIDAFYPSTLAEVDYSNYLQDQQVIKIVFHPIRFNPVKGSLEFYKRIRLEVLQEGAEAVVADSSVAPKLALPLTEDNAYKVYITEDGIYRLTKSYLESKGISLASADPTKLKIYNQGSEIPIYVFGEEDGQFGESDYIEFYAEAVDTRYTGTNVYWLVLSDTAGLRMTASAQDETATTTLGSFLDTYKKEDNTLYWMESKGEDHWFIDAIYGSQVYDLTLDLNGVANTANEATLKVALEGSVYSGTAFTHHIYARLNGHPIADVSWKGDNEYIIEAKVSQSYLNEGANTVTLEVGEDSTGYEEILVNWAEVSYWRAFNAKDNVLTFGNYTSGTYLYQISGFTNQNVEIYDITQPNNVLRITQVTVVPEGSTFVASFKDVGSKKYIVLTEDKAKVPNNVALDEPSNLAEKTNKADYIIIIHPDFYDAIQPFAEYRSGQGLKVKVVKLDDIYDEFNYGIADVAAIKDFLKYAYYNWISKPAYVLLVGDATYDYRDYSGYGFTNYVPTYLVHSLYFGETGTDNWFVCFDGESDVIPDMLIGRFPVKTTDELRVVIDKIIRYEAVSPEEDWTKKMLLVVDDDEKIFADTSENLASYLTKGYTADKQYLGTTTNDPAVLRQNIINSINDGRLFVNYAGHGGIGLWANERIFTWSDINYLYNKYTLPVFTTLTCANGYFVYPRYVESLGERLFTVKDAGAIASFVPSGISFPTTQAYLADGFYGAFFDDKDAILGSMVARGKLSVYENTSGGDAVNVIQTYVLFGDPALRVRIKAPQIPAVAAPQVFNLSEGKVNGIFRLTDEPESSSNNLADVITTLKEQGATKKGLTKIIHGEEEVLTTPSPEEGVLEDKVIEHEGLDTEDIQLEDKTEGLAPPKWKFLSKADTETLNVVKTFAGINYELVDKSATGISVDAKRLAELREKFDEAVAEADFQRAKLILRDITKLARKIYWNGF